MAWPANARPEACVNRLGELFRDGGLQQRHVDRPRHCGQLLLGAPQPARNMVASAVGSRCKGLGGRPAANEPEQLGRADRDRHVCGLSACGNLRWRAAASN